MENTRKGFTLVELLAVIVILAIIMIIAIPSVLGTMTTSRKKVFCEYVTKVYMATQNKYLSGQTLGDANAGSSFNVVYGYDGDYHINLGYDITEDLGLENTGNYKGISIVIKPTTDDPNIYIAIALYDDNYALMGEDGVFYFYDEEPNPETDLIDVNDEYVGISNEFMAVVKRDKYINIMEFNTAHGF